MATDKHIKLSDDAAGKLLANVFDACGQEPNTIPLPKLASYSEYRREKYSFQKILLAVVLVIFCLLPLCFIAPQFDIVQTSPMDAKTPTYEVRVKSHIVPVSLVAADIDGHPQSVYESGERIFTIEPKTNGIMTIKVQLSNKQYGVKSISVTGADNKSPVLIKDEKIGDRLYLYIEDDVSGIDWEGIYGETMDGNMIDPISYSESGGYVVFEFPSESINIYIPDFKENILQLVLTTT